MPRIISSQWIGADGVYRAIRWSKAMNRYLCFARDVRAEPGATAAAIHGGLLEGKNYGTRIQGRIEAESYAEARRELDTQISQILDGKRAELA